MEFLVRIEVEWPPDGDVKQKARLIEEESARAAELARSGVLRRLWRIPGRWANYGLWEAEDATELHAALASLPFFPWLDIDVQPLADHPSDPCRNQQPP
jgi:muconolactone D-isomerase